MAFNNASLGYVHAMAHQLGGMYDLPHGVCNALLLPHVQAFNASVAAPRLSDIARALDPASDAGLEPLTAAQGAERCLQAIRSLAAEIGIPTSLAQLGVRGEDIPLLAANALKDACGLTNPRPANQADIEAIFRQAM